MIRSNTSSSNKLRKRVHNQLRADDDRRLQTSIHGALIGEEAVHAVRGFPVTLFRLKLQPHMNAPDDEYVLLQFNLTQRFRYKTLVRCTDLTRFQRASKCTSKSTGCSRDNIIQRGGVGFENRRRNL